VDGSGSSPSRYAASAFIADHSVELYNLMEHLQACGYGLPVNPVPDDQGIVWF
jgi:hypothetical protein